MYEPLNFHGKTVLMTGGSSGVGREIALRAADRGAAVVNADLRRDPRDAEVPTDELVEQRGGTATYVETDVTDLEAVCTAADRAVESIGGLDVVVNNAGRAESYAVTETSLENWATALSINLTGVYHGCLAGVERMLDDSGGPPHPHFQYSRTRLNRRVCPTATSHTRSRTTRSAGRSLVPAGR